MTKISKEARKSATDSPQKIKLFSEDKLTELVASDSYIHVKTSTDFAKFRVTESDEDGFDARLVRSTPNPSDTPSPIEIRMSDEDECMEDIDTGSLLLVKLEKHFVEYEVQAMDERGKYAELKKIGATARLNSPKSVVVDGVKYTRS